MRTLNYAIKVALGRQRNRTGNLSTRLLSGVYDELGGLIHDLMIVTLQADADILFSHFYLHSERWESFEPEGLSVATSLADNLFCHVLGHGLVGVELHGVRSTTLSATAQVGCITEHLAQRNLSRDANCVATLLLALDETTAAGDIAHNEAGVLFRSLNQP